MITVITDFDYEYKPETDQALFTFHMLETDEFVHDPCDVYEKDLEPVKATVPGWKTFEEEIEFDGYASKEDFWKMEAMVEEHHELINRK